MARVDSDGACIDMFDTDIVLGQHLRRLSGKPQWTQRDTRERHRRTGMMMGFEVMRLNFSEDDCRVTPTTADILSGIAHLPIGSKDTQSDNIAHEGNSSAEEIIESCPILQYRLVNLRGKPL